ncbi:MAG TPA: glutamate--tRNA ligase [Candidatus Saccharimonadales bacterium]|nr:glutamate--tRNA ligase [Candidatus Saccharimonadales bacterium]
MSSVRTRFAPSPTGFLHVGGVRTAFYNYLFAQHHGGTFILRLEDTDRERFVPEGVGQIVEALDWLGLEPNEGFWISQGQHKNIEYIQSERQKTGLYQKVAEQLVEQGLAYYSYVTPERYQEYKQDAAHQPFVYRKSMEAEFHDGKSPGPEGEYPIRLDVEAIRTEFHHLADNGVAWHDEIRGDFVDNLSLIEDFILIKSDGFPTYNFANVVDDHEMQISHVIRGDEFISSTSKHVLLYELFGWQAPKFVHLPPINGLDGKKLSKRTGDTNTLEYRDKGYLPEALLNFLVLLGWNDGSTQEVFSQQELIDKFSLDRLNTSPAVFDPKRLDWMNGSYIRELSIDALYKKVADFWPDEAQAADDAYKKQVLGLVQERLKYFSELPELTRFFFVDLPVDDSLISEHKQLKKLSSGELRDLLEKAKASLEASSFTTDDLTQKLNDLLEQTGQKPAVLFSLIRIATTQAPASPALADSLAALGKDRSLSRIETQLKHLG